MGLTITKKLVEMLGGTIDVESVLGEGSTFSFALPVATSERMEASDNAPPSPRDHYRTMSTAPAPVLTARHACCVRGIRRVYVVESAPRRSETDQKLTKGCGIVPKACYNGRRCPNVFDCIRCPDALS